MVGAGRGQPARWRDQVRLCLAEDAAERGRGHAVRRGAQRAVVRRRQELEAQHEANLAEYERDGRHRPVRTQAAGSAA